MNRVLLVVVFLSYTLYTLGQAPHRFYTKFGGNGDEVAYSGKQALDKHYIVAGSSTSYGLGNTDAYLVKVDTMGNVLWQKFIGGVGNDLAKSIIQLSDSGFVLVGATNSFGNGGYDAYIVRTDKNGIVIWQKTYGGTNWDFANDVVQDSDGNLVFIGKTESYGNGKSDGFIVKFDLLGNLIWQKFMGGVEDDELISIITTKDSNIAVAGVTRSPTDLNGDGCFLKYNSNGDTLFTYRFGGNGKDLASDLIQKTNSDFIICGAKTFTSNIKSESYMVCIDSFGKFKWENNYYASKEDESYISVCDSKTVLDLSNFLRNVPVPAYAIQGNLMLGTTGGYPYSVNSFGGTEDEWFFSLESTKDKGYLCVGFTESFNSYGKDIFLMKEDSTIQNYQSVMAVEEKYNNKKEILLRNLAPGKFSISTAEPNRIQMIRVVTILGNELIVIKRWEEHIIIDLSSFQENLYLIEFTFEDGSHTVQKLYNVSGQN